MLEEAESLPDFRALSARLREAGYGEPGKLSGWVGETKASRGSRVLYVPFDSAGADKEASVNAHFPLDAAPFAVSAEVFSLEARFDAARYSYIGEKGLVVGNLRLRDLHEKGFPKSDDDVWMRESLEPVEGVPLWIEPDEPGASCVGWWVHTCKEFCDRDPEDSCGALGAAACIACRNRPCGAACAAFFLFLCRNKWYCCRWDSRHMRACY
jgi:hypothetical protein